MMFSRNWSKRLGWLALGIFVPYLGGLLVVNVLDYRRYYWAAHFEKSVGLAKVRELARTCFELGKAGEAHLSEYPENIARLKPCWVEAGPKHAQIGLYRNGADASVFLTFEKQAGNEVVAVYGYTRGASESRPLYVQDQAAYDLLHPKNRIVTLAQGSMHEYYEWVVLPDEVRVMGRANSGDWEILGRRPISAGDREAIAAAIKSIPAPVRGRRYTSGAMDGISLDIRFGPEGRLDPVSGRGW